MRHRSILVVLVIAFISAFFALIFITIKVHAQNEIITVLSDRLTYHNVPYSNIEIRSQIPFDVEITILSVGEDKEDIPKNMWNTYITEREAMLAEKYGFRLHSYTVILLNKTGKTLSWGQYFPADDKVPYPSGSAIRSNVDAAKLVMEDLDLNNMRLDSINITDEVGKDDTIQFLSLKLSIPDIRTANQELPKFIPVMHQTIEKLNTERGTRIAICHLEIFDGKGEMILSYILDLEMTRQIWWTADAITATWFPQPAPEHTSTTVPSLFTTPYPLPKPNIIPSPYP